MMTLANYLRINFTVYSKLTNNYDAIALVYAILQEGSRGITTLQKSEFITNKPFRHLKTFKYLINRQQK